MPARNDPCPCGSAVKYERCCLALMDTVAHELRARDAILGDIVDWIKDQHEAVLHEASQQTMLIRMLRGPAGRNMSMLWAINDFRPPDGGPPLTLRFAERSDLDSDARELVRGLVDATLDVFRVVDAMPDPWIVLEPLRGGELTTVMTGRGFAD